MHTETDPLDTERLDLKRTSKTRGFYADKVVNGASMIEQVGIEKIAPGAARLSPEELDAIQLFTLHWTLFETQALDTDASAKKIAKKVKGITPETIAGGWFEEHLDYFSRRYIQNGEPNSRFEHLHLRKGDNPELVLAVLTGGNVDPMDQLIACLTIVYRFRNNFFHGIKWAYGVQDQLDNFTRSVSLLREYLLRVPAQ